MGAVSTFRMIIELKSDMCCGTGETSGVSVDQVTALDDHGLPVIPAKRLKGLLREEAQLIELPRQAGFTDALFGVHGREESGKLSFKTARLIGHALIEKTIENRLLTPGMVASVYTVTRTTTSVEDDGVAKDHTLRTMQLVRRCDTSGEPTRFSCCITGRNLSQGEMDFFHDVVRCLRAVGQKKSRGLGEVACEGAWEIEDETSMDDARHGAVDKSSKRMGYRITLKEPAVIQGGSGEALDYVPGSAVQGIFAKLLKDDERALRDCVLRNTRFSNAYVDVDKKGNVPSLPVPQVFRAKKNDMGAEGAPSSSFALYDVTAPQAQEQAEARVQQVGLYGYGAVVGGQYLVAETAQAMSFHSSSPDSPQGKQYYSLCSINAGQSFSGTIESSPDALKRLAGAVGAKALETRVGAAGTSGFGACEITTYPVHDDALVQLSEGDHVIIQFTSDAIYVDDQGRGSVDVSSFAKELSASGTLGFTFSLLKAYIKTRVVGGYNAHWGLPKRQYVAFGKGSTLVVAVTGCEGGPVERIGWTGLLNEEGFGQLLVQKPGDRAMNTYVKVFPATLSQAGGDAAQRSGSQAERQRMCQASFVHDLAYNEACEKAVLEACKLGDRYELGAASKSSFMRISSIYRSACKDATPGGVQERFLSLAAQNLADDEALKKQCEGLCVAFGTLMQGYEDMAATCRDGVFKKIVQAYLRQVKVRYSTLKGGSDA